MQQMILFFALFIIMSNFQCSENALTEWTTFVTSTHYANKKLVLEAWNPFKPQYINKGSNSAMMAQVMCNRICAHNPKCVALNFYSIATHYVCEYLPENFCIKTQRLALQAWPEGQVWDKLRPGTKSACIDQKFASNTTNNYCEIGRSGCQSVWPHCDTCVQSCRNCSTLYGKSGLYECTFWPEGPFKRPIFGFCESRATILIKRKVFLIGQGYASPDYRMLFEDMNRLYKLGVYKCIAFTFTNTRGKNYTAAYENFAISKSGTLSNMIFRQSSGTDGFKTGSIPLKAAPFTWNTPSLFYNCGPFWLLNSTQGTIANEYCPGGKVNIFGNVINTMLYKDTGIKWPKATTEGAILNYAEMKMDL